MEKAEKVNINEKPTEQVKNGIGGSSCPFWFFGNEDSAKKDLDDKFEIVDDEED